MISTFAGTVTKSTQYAAAIAIFLGTRAVIVASLLFSNSYIVPNQGEGLWDSGSAWYHHLLRWDSGWYLQIAKVGYVFPIETLEAKAAAFYPLYPLTSKALTLVGLTAPIALLLVSNIAAILSAALMFKLVKDQFDQRTALLTVALFGLFPTSVFLSAGYSESLALLLCLICFVCLREKRLVLAAVAAGLATASRSTGLVLLPIILFEVWRSDRAASILARVSRACIFGGIAVSGLLAYICYLWIAVDDPMRFSSVQSHWNAGTTLGERLEAALKLAPLSNVNNIGLHYFLAAMLLLISVRRQLDSSQLAFGIGVLLLPYLTLAGGFHSMPRFVLLSFPIYIGLALLCRERPLATICIGSASAIGLFVNTALFSQWYWIG